MTVGYKAYEYLKRNFIEKHNCDWTVETSPMDEYGVYYKHYIFEDGAIWYERMAPVYRSKEVEFEVEGLTFKKTVEVKLFETEFFNSDRATSYKYYEKF